MIFIFFSFCLGGTDFASGALGPTDLTMNERAPVLLCYRLSVDGVEIEKGLIGICIIDSNSH